MADDKIRLPSGMGGLTSFGEQTGSLIKLKPAHVVILAGAVALFIILLHLGAL